MGAALDRPSAIERDAAVCSAGARQVLIASSSCWVRNVLRTEPSAPQSTNRSPSATVGDIATIRTPGLSRRIACTAAIPSGTSGRRGSIRTASGFVARTTALAALAAPALPTTSSQPPIPSSATSDSRVRSSASTTTTRGRTPAGMPESAGAPSIIPAVSCPPGPPTSDTRRTRNATDAALPLRHSSVRAVRHSDGPGRADGNDDFDSGAGADGAPDVEMATELLGTRPHAGQPEVTVGDLRRIEPAAVVRHAQPDTLGDAADLHTHLARSGVLDDVVERLLRDAVQRLLHIDGRTLRQVGLHDHGQPDPPGERRSMRPERGDQTLLLDVAGPELEDQRPHLRERVTLEVAQR